MPQRQPTIKNLTVNDSSETSYAIPYQGTRFIIQARDSDEFQMSYVLGESNSNYITIKSGVSYEEKELAKEQTLYFYQVTGGSIVLEIISWV